MHDPAYPVRRRLIQSSGARRNASTPPTVTGLRALISGSNHAQLPNSERATPRRATAVATAHACEMGGRYMTTFCCGGLEETFSIPARSMRLAWWGFGP